MQVRFGNHHLGPEMRPKLGRGALDTHCAYPMRWAHILVQFSVPFCGFPFRSARRTVLARAVRPHSTPDQHAIAYIQPMFVYRVCLRRKEHIQPLPCIPIPHEHPRSSYLAAQRVFMMAPTAYSYLVRLSSLPAAPASQVSFPRILYCTFISNDLSEHVHNNDGAIDAAAARDILKAPDSFSKLLRGPQGSSKLPRGPQSSSELSGAPQSSPELLRAPQSSPEIL